MNVYFDESGQTGCVIKKDDFLNFRESPSFALAGIVVDDVKKKKLEEEYIKFKNKFNIIGEIKGTDLLTRNNNDKLYYFVDNILPILSVYINIYDKRFYLSTLMLSSFTGLDSIDYFKYEFYTQASLLAKQDDEFYIEYLDFIDRPTVKSFRKYLKFLISYNYKYFEDPYGNKVDNIIVLLAKKILDERIESSFVKDFMTYGWYTDRHVTNLVNLNCLYESIYVIKKDLNDIKLNVIHDEIEEFEEVIKHELSGCNCELSFDDSKNNQLLQISDNVVSIFRHLYDRGVYYCSNNKMWDKSSAWDLELFSKVQNIISVTHIKYTVPLCDHALCLSICNMFSKEYPIEQRTTLNFNLILNYNYNLICNDLISNDLTLKDVEEVVGN